MNKKEEGRKLTTVKYCLNFVCMVSEVYIFQNKTCNYEIFGLFSLFSCSNASVVNISAAHFKLDILFGNILFTFHQVLLLNRIWLGFWFFFFFYYPESFCGVWFELSA